MKKIILLLILCCAACTANKNTSTVLPKIKSSTNAQPAPIKPESANRPTTIDFSGPTTTVYKTKADYNNKVPVTLSEDKTKIVAYPSPKDVFYNGTLAYPTQLAQGYLLDNRGIGKNVAFLNITYEEYSNLSEVPDLKSMYNMIIDKDPLRQMCNCGNRQKYANVIVDINRLINDNKLSKCQKIK